MFGSRSQVKTWQQIRDMERAGHIVAGMLAAVRAEIRAGVTTGELDQIAEAFLDSAGGLSNFKGYYDYPAVICASVRVAPNAAQQATASVSEPSGRPAASQV